MVKLLNRGWVGLEAFPKVLYKNTYFLPNEEYEEWLHRVTESYANDAEHAKRMQIYINNYWFHPSTPISSNAGTDRGLPIACYTRSVADSKESIFNNYMEAFWLGSKGGGIGTSWSSVREVNASVGKHGGTSSGIIPFMSVSDRATLAVSQGGLRRASEAVYLRIDHPEIEEFIELRKPTGDPNRRSPNLHHGVIITDDFMKAVIYNRQWDLISPYNHKVIKTVSARKLWERLLEVRATLKGEPYLLFIDTVNKMSPIEYKKEGIKVNTSNLCTEITLRTDDKNTGVCCLGSINLEYWDEYAGFIDQFIADCSDYLDNVLQDFIDKTEGLPGFEKARRAAIDERSIGLGAMGFHSYLQRKNIPWESSLARSVNRNIFKIIYLAAKEHNNNTPKICPMAQRTGTKKRNIHVIAIAPTMSISTLANLTSSGVEPWITNTFTKKVKQGAFAIKNRYLDKIIRENTPESNPGWYEDQWKSIKDNQGSVQHLDWMDDWTKAVFKTAFEIDQRWVIEFAGDRQLYIDQAQSINLFIPGGSSTQYISDLHILAWKRGLKSLYYLRSSAVNRASTNNNKRKQINIKEPDMLEDTCLGCT